MRLLAYASLVLAIALLAPTASAQEGGGTARVTPVEPHPMSEYGGVTPGEGRPPAERRLARRRARRAVIATWPGFSPSPSGGTRFFLQLTQAVAPRVVMGTDRVEVVLPQTTIHLANSRRWLETAHFETPVTRARLERRGRDMVFVMYLRAGVSPSVTSAPGEGGYTFVYIDFPAGRYRPEELAPPPVATAPEGGSVTVVQASPAPAPAPGPRPMTEEEARALDEERPPPASGPRP